MKDLSAEDILKRFNKAKERKSMWDNHLRECYDLALPDKQTINKHSPGQKKNLQVFDSTAVTATQKFANRMQHQLVPPWKQWMRFEPGSEIAEEEAQGIQSSLDEITDIFFDHINHSNFSTQIHESFTDLAISTGAIIIEEGDGINSSLHFRSVSLSEIYPETTSRGIVDNVYREFEIPVRDIINVYPNAKLTEELTRMVSEAPDKEVTLIECVIFEEKEKEYCTYLVYPTSKSILYEDDSETSPWVVFREFVTPGETLGRGRVMQILPDIKTLNKIVEFNLRNAAMAISGVYTAVDDGVINPYTIKLQPNSIIPVASNETSAPSLRPLDRSGDFNLSQLLISEYRNQINDFMFAQPFGRIEETPVRTATEMGIRNQDLMQTTMSSFGRMQTELLEQMVKRCADILKKAGKLPDVRVDGKEVTIKFTSPMARTQDMEELQTFNMFMQAMMVLPPEIQMGAVKYEDIPQFIADKLGISQDLIRSKAEQQQVKQAALQMQAQQGAIDGQPQ